MRIGMFSECYKPTMNGVVVSIKTFKEGLENRGHEVWVFAPKTADHKDNDPHIIRYPSFGLPKDYPLVIPIAPRIYQQILKLNLDIIHTQHLFSMGIIGLRTARHLNLPLIHTYHTLIAEYTHYVPFASGLSKKFLIWWSKKFCNWTDQIITPTPPVKRVLQDYGVTKPIECIPTGIYLERYKRRAPAIFKEKWHIPAEQKILLYVGRIAREKNIFFLLECFTEMFKKSPDVHLVLIGSGPQEKEVKKFVKERNLAKFITLTGFLPKAETEKAFGSADVFVFPSTTDTQAIVVVEAMAAGTPPVAINKLGPSAIIHDGEDGYLTALNHQDFIERITRVVYNPTIRADLSRTAQKTAQNYSVDVTTHKLEELYVQASDTNRSQPQPFLPFGQGKKI